MGERRVARKRGRARLRLSPLRPRPPPQHTHPAPWELSARIGFQLSCGGQSSGEGNREGNRRAAPARSLPLGGLGPSLGESPSQIGVVGEGVRPQGKRILGARDDILGFFFSPELPSYSGHSRLPEVRTQGSPPYPQEFRMRNARSPLFLQAQQVLKAPNHYFQLPLGGLLSGTQNA